MSSPSASPSNDSPAPGESGSSAPSGNSPRLRQAPFLVGLFLVTASTLTLEVLLTRLLSVLTWYSLAYLVIGMGLFGLTAGALRVYLRPERYVPSRLAAQLARDTLWMALAVPVAYVLLLIIPLRVAPNATTVALFVVFSFVIALPFVPAGAVVAASLTRSGFPVGRIYAVDLAGAALGAPFAPLLLAFVDGGTAILAIGALAALGAMGYAASGADRALVLRAGAVALALGLLTVGNASSDRGLVPLWVKGEAEDRSRIELETWNSHSRIQLTKAWTGPALMWARGRCQPETVTQRWITIDGDAGTALYHADPDVASMRFLACDVTSVVHQIRRGGSMAIIGVGGSRDLQAALVFDHRPVVGVELNGRMLEILQGPLGAPTQVADSPHVELVHDDARGWMTRTDRRFQVVQMSLIDTWAATGAGAHALGENGLYTVDAWEVFLDRLEPRGILSVSRWYQRGGHDETSRLIGLATAALIERGVDEPARHIALIAVGRVATLLVSPDPLSEADVAGLRSAEERMGFEILLAPGRRAEDHPGVDELAGIVEVNDRAQLDARLLDETYDLRPPTDERPFFFNLLRIRAWLADIPEDAGGAIEGNRRATSSLVLAFFAALFLVTVAIILPLALRPRSEKAAPGWVTASGVAYFGLIGVAFMLAEVGLLLRLSVVLGHPVYSLIVVLSSLIGAAGLGSWISDFLPLDSSPACYLYPLVIAGVLLTLALLLPGWSASLSEAPLGQRIAYGGAISATLGLVLGVAFPAGMRLFEPVLERETPWLWGINGVGGVLASSVAIMLALGYGLSWLLLAAALGYAGLLPLIGLALRARRASLGGENVPKRDLAA